MDHPRRIRCRRCPPDPNKFVFYHPDQVYCANCERLVGESDHPVLVAKATVDAPRSVVYDPDTGEEYAGIEWDRDRVAIL